MSNAGCITVWQLSYNRFKPIDVDFSESSARRCNLKIICDCQHNTQLQTVFRVVLIKFSQKTNIKYIRNTKIQKKKGLKKRGTKPEIKADKKEKKE